MIPYSRDPRQTIPTSAVKIIGLGGAGANMLERIALDGMEGAELLALNTDVRTLASCLAKEKIQLGVNLTKGLGAGGDPELGHQAVLEAEDQIRNSLKGRRIVFLCTGLGGGTGSGAAPIVTRIAREEGAFVVVFATMPFAFEGKRRREQAETSLNELAVLSNALVTFDNNRMGELVLAKQGIHEAFIAADHMISESIKAVIRLVVRPGLINVGLDDLMSALRTNRSRCLFGSGLANGKDRAIKALRNALSSPLLDQGTLLKEAQTVLVHLCGGEDLTLFEIELLMQRLQKFVPERAHVLFGAAVDPSMGDNLSLTLISALPEDSLAMAPRESLSQARDNPLLDPSQGFTPPRREKPPVIAPPPLPEAVVAPVPEPEPPALEIPVVEPPRLSPAEPPPVPPVSKVVRAVAGPPAVAAALDLFSDERPFAEPEERPSPFRVAGEGTSNMGFEPFTLEDDGIRELDEQEPPKAEEPEVEDAWEPEPPEPEEPAEMVNSPFRVMADSIPAKDRDVWDADEIPESTGNADEDEELQPTDLASSGFTPIPKKRPPGVTPWTIGNGPKTSAPKWNSTAAPATEEPATEEPAPVAEQIPAAAAEPEVPKLKLGIKAAGPQSELSLDSTPRGRFEGESPNVFEGEDLDLPPFLRKKK